MELEEVHREFYSQTLQCFILSAYPQNQEIHVYVVHQESRKVYHCLFNYDSMPKDLKKHVEQLRDLYEYFQESQHIGFENGILTIRIYHGPTQHRFKQIQIPMNQANLIPTKLFNSHIQKLSNKYKEAEYKGHKIYKQLQNRLMQLDFLQDQIIIQLREQIEKVTKSYENQCLKTRQFKEEIDKKDQQIQILKINIKQYKQRDDSLWLNKQRQFREQLNDLQRKINDKQRELKQQKKGYQDLQLLYLQIKKKLQGNVLDCPSCKNRKLKNKKHNQFISEYTEQDRR